jgi:hypothetical protein
MWKQRIKLGLSGLLLFAFVPYLKAQATDPREIIALASESEPASLPREFGRFGLALKSGEAAGTLGIQLSWNFSWHAQICAGTGGVADLNFYLIGDRGRTDSYYVLGKAYWKHLYLTTGYSLKISKVERTLATKVITAAQSEQGIPLHLGYEFGRRSGFFFATSVGYLYIFGGGNRDVATGSAIGPTKSRTAKSSPSLGMSIGYYLW